MMNVFFTPLINNKKTNKFTPIINFTENYFSYGARCYKFVQIKANGAMDVIESKHLKTNKIYTAFKIATMILSLGIFPLIMLVIKFFYRVNHPLNFIKPLSSSFLDNQPIAILNKLFTEFFSPSNLLKEYTLLNKHFNTMINQNFMKWESIYKEIAQGLSKKELDSFIQRIKTLYTQGKEPSFKQKVQYLCQELWEEAIQIPHIQKIIQEKELTISHLTIKKQYDHLKTLIQPIKDMNLIWMIEEMKLKILLDDENFKNGNEEKKADLIREWFNSDKSSQELIKIKMIGLGRSPFLLSTEMLTYMKYMPNLETFFLSYAQISHLPEAIGNLSQLKQLFLNRNKLSALPKTIKNLSKLAILNLEYNQFSTFPEPIAFLNRLRELHIGHNQIPTLFDNIKNLNQLEYLDLSNNQLSTLPDAIGNLSKLYFISLRNNQLSTLPDTIGNLNLLETLYLKNNNLSTLPDTLKNLNQLQIFRIDYSAHIPKEKVQKLLPSVNLDA